MNMTIKHVANTRPGQDGAIYGKYLFRFSAMGICHVYDMSELSESKDSVTDLEVISTFALDKIDTIVPHSNAVVFGNEFFEKGDEFPLLYSNVYNNYSNAEEKHCGVCCVYRLQRKGLEFTTTLLQIIEIGFTDDCELWRSGADVHDSRPYGNFVIDTERSLYYAFVMRDGEHTTRYFSFDLPKISQGVTDERFGVKKVVLDAKDILGYFDTPYHKFIQGACVSNGLIYSVEGFDERIHPAIRVIDPIQKKQVFHLDFFESNLPIEAEFIDFYNGKCYYGNCKGNIFELDFKDS